MGRPAMEESSHLNRLLDDDVLRVQQHYANPGCISISIRHATSVDISNVQEDSILGDSLQTLLPSAALLPTLDPGFRGMRRLEPGQKPDIIMQEDACEGPWLTRMQGAMRASLGGSSLDLALSYAANGVCDGATIDVHRPEPDLQVTVITLRGNSMPLMVFSDKPCSWIAEAIQWRNGQPLDQQRILY